ncbi:MAG: hypothetical protein G8345_14020, partial [Magnetococcales bacterium]|nr:hypothetical protein [Magnetococcales bacterium]
MADALLATMDLLNQWLDAIERDQQLPSDAAQRGESLAATLRGLMAGANKEAPTTKSTPEAEKEEEWLNELPATLFTPLYAAHLQEDTLVTVVSYQPDSGCFFMGEDPLFTLSQVPELVSFILMPTVAWNCGGEFDPFDCRLHFYVISTAPRQQVAELFQYVEQQVKISHLPVQRLLNNRQMVSRELLIQVLKEQKEVLDMPMTPAEWVHVFPSTIQILRYTLSQYMPAILGSLDVAVKQSEKEKGFAPLRCFMENLSLTDKPPQPAKREGGEVAAETGDKGAIRTLKVDNSRIDRLMELAGELVVAKNAMPYLAQMALHNYGAKDLSSRIMESYGQMNRLVEEVQSSILQVRMLPVGTVFQRFPRLVRDTSRKLDKQVRRVMEGEETEADKNIIE